jgi:hypothetical protein
MAPFSKPKYPKITTELAYCLDSHIGPDDIVYREGDLIASDDKDVVSNPIYYAPAGLPTAKYHEIRMDRFMRHLAEAEVETAKGRTKA